MIEFNKRNFRTWSIMGINPSVWSIGFTEIISQNDNVAVLTADLKRYSGLERTFSNYKEKCFNLGIAEQNMVGIAAGMAMEGTQVYITTYAPFMSYRCADQVRHLMGNLNLNIKAIGSAAGLSAGLSGPSLLAISDMAFMRSIPNMVVLSPADCTEAVKLTLEMSKNNLPTYMRFCGATNIPPVYSEDYCLEIGKPVLLRQGKDIALLATGTDIVFNVLEVAEKLAEMTGFEASVYNVHTLKPMDDKIYAEIFSKNKIIFTIEEHSIIGGLGSAVLEKMSELRMPGYTIRIGVPDQLFNMGNREYMLEQAGLSKETIFDRINNEINFWEENNNAKIRR